MKQVGSLESWDKQHQLYPLSSYPSRRLLTQHSHLGMIQLSQTDISSPNQGSLTFGLPQ